MDAAQKLGVDPTFSIVPPQMGYWLEKRGPPRFWRKSLHMAKGNRSRALVWGRRELHATASCVEPFECAPARAACRPTPAELS
jgi:hypothetical protein